MKRAVDLTMVARGDWEECNARVTLVKVLGPAEAEWERHGRASIVEQGEESEEKEVW